MKRKECIYTNTANRKGGPQKSGLCQAGRHRYCKWTIVLLVLLCVLLLVLLIWQSISRNQLLTSCRNLSKEVEDLQATVDKLVAKRDQLKSDTDKLPNTLEREKMNRKISSSPEVQTWEESRKYCMEKGEDLVIINSREKHDVITEKNLTGWIGLKKEWKWVDSTSTYNIEFWADGQPDSNRGANEDCVGIPQNLPHKSLHDFRCSEKKKAICEK
ncbi:hepatic lectin-like [Denticeps clupeoides]|uniref:hepatic lectin-like n=1 Tax=Denticeps clupeoides TaxID=299321 RepID=UPI0010A537BB|nr:hepatic lectin-like [Denticeps clupeoides]